MTIAAMLFASSAALLAQSPAIERVDLPGGCYWLARPADFDPTARYPLIVCLHGTDAPAEDILRFWLSLHAELPFIFVAPQGADAGWRDADLKLFTELRSHLDQTLNYDPTRVLLTGHSAGGAMAFHLLYAEGFPATAIAVTANYVPPTVTADMVAARRGVPVFYAVGEADLNRPRQREGLYLLRGAGASVTVQRPPIGHVLSPEISQAALEWFESICREQVRQTIEAARLDVTQHHCLGQAADSLETILRNRRAHYPEHVSLAAGLLNELQQPGRKALADAAALLQDEQPMAARDLLIEAEQRYQPSSLAAEARARRQEVDALPKVAEELAARRQAEHEKAAADLWKSALAALAAARLNEAERCARDIVELYPQSAPADDARNLLDEIEAVNGLGQP